MRHNISTGLAASMLLLLGLGACTSDLDAPSMQQENNDTLLKLDINIADTRAGIDATSFETGDSIRVVVCLDGASYGNDNYSVYSESIAVYDGNQWVLDNPIDLAEIDKNNTTGFVVYAQYPYSEYVTYNPTSRVFDVSTKVLDLQMDVMYGNSSVSLDNPTAKINFKHAFARVTLKISNPTEVDLSVTELKIGNSGTSDYDFTDISYLAGPTSLSPKDGFTGTNNLDSLILQTDLTIGAGAESTLDILLSPNEEQVKAIMSVYGSLPGGLSFTASVSGLDKQIQFTIPTPQLFGSQQYTYKLDMSNGLKGSDEEVEGNEEDEENVGKNILFQQTFENVSDPEELGWSFGGSYMTIEKDEFGNYLDLSLGQCNGRSAQVTWGSGIYFDEYGNSILPDGKYNMSFDFCIQQNSNNQFNSCITVFTNHTPLANQNYRLPWNPSGVWDNYLLDLSQCNTTVEEDMLITVNAPLILNDEEYTIDNSESYKLSTGMWYIVNLSVNVETREVDFIINQMNGELLVSGSSTIPYTDSNGDTISMYAEGLFVLLARYYSQILFDNICISY